MRKKAITKDCKTCDDMKANDDGKYECHFGNSKVRKILLPQKGKKRLKCKLI